MHGFSLDIKGAVAANARPDIAEHFGDPAAEQRALVAGCGLVDLADMEVVTVSGCDRLNWLTTLSSQICTGIVPSAESREALLLDHNGRIEHQFRLIDDGQVAYLIVDAGRAKALVEFLTRMIFSFRVEVKDATKVFACLGIAAHGVVLEALKELGSGMLWCDPWPGVVTGGTSYSTRSEPYVATAISLVDRNAAPAMAKQVLARATELVGDGATDADGYVVRAAMPVGVSAWEAIRVANWRPMFNAEVDDRTVPHELDWLRTAVHLNKGCYCGQETVARIVNLGRPARRLVQLDLDGDTQMPSPGAEVVVSRGDRRKVVGHITTVARHYEQGVIALALVQRSIPDGDFSVDNNPVTLTNIVNPDGKSAASPMRRPGADLKRISIQRRSQCEQ